jgi:threonine/homoserine/homoserine lactone efflux protein
MTLSPSDLVLYAVALLILFLTPGPVWRALMARAVSGGFAAAWPLALGVAIGDMVWPFLAVMGVSWVVSELSGAMTVLRFVACGMFLWLGVGIWRNADTPPSGDNRLTRPGRRAGFVAGVVVILGNPKAILFYMGVLPGFFDLASVTAVDIAAIVALSMAVPLVGNVFFALLVGRLRDVLATPSTIGTLNRSAAVLLIGVGILIPFT